MNTCSGENHLLGASRMEYIDCSNGEITWRCLDCGETVLQVQDCNGGQVLIQIALTCLFVVFVLFVFPWFIKYFQVYVEWVLH